ncbi:hypothetical protein K2173_002013 [Erythroxylum novogranatense]|uniref:Zinc finger PHD-type domain-containing protein n=1 Tax=Erythroxylum novogranatense TaxID=1862640 RepID=A0AAV8SPZ8_9ROSI|nr:hypothetical protein K2173_002013 [Erythroxylum novogranatense]
MREMVALRRLEDLFGPTDRLTNEFRSGPDQRVTFDFSQSCEDVLQSILRETSVSDLKLAGPGSLKWDIRSFIMHKRASMPRCALEQLRDSIIDNTHPYAESLKGLSGLIPTNSECERTFPGRSDENTLNSLDMRTLVEKFAGTTHQKRTLVEKFAGTTHQKRTLVEKFAGTTHQKRKLVEKFAGTTHQKRTLVEKFAGTTHQKRTLVEKFAGTTHQKHSFDESSGNNDPGEKNSAVFPDAEMRHIFEDDKSNDSDEYHNEEVNVVTKLCVKCGKGDQLLSCSAADCSVLVHENCLSSLMKFDRKNFYCPFCVYTLAVSESVEAEKMSYLANIFSECQPKGHTERFPKEQHINSKQNPDEETCGRNPRDVECSQIKSGECLDTPNDHLFQRRPGDNQVGTLDISGRKINLCSEVKEAHAIVPERESCPTIKSGRQQDQIDPGRPSYDQMHKNHEYNGESKSMEHVLGNQSQEGGMEQEQITNSLAKPAINIDEGASYSIRLRQRDRKNIHPVAPKLRRKIAPWTAKEEGILKLLTKRPCNHGGKTNGCSFWKSK